MATARMSQVIRRDSAMRKTTVIKTKREPEQQCLSTTTTRLHTLHSSKNKPRPHYVSIKLIMVEVYNSYKTIYMTVTRVFIN